MLIVELVVAQSTLYLSTHQKIYCLAWIIIALEKIKLVCRSTSELLLGFAETLLTENNLFISVTY